MYEEALEGETDIDRFKHLTSEEIEKAAKSDPDSALPTKEQLKEFRRRGLPVDKKD